MKKLILHIPHASTNIPLIDGYSVDEDFLKSEILKLTDWYTDDLFINEIDEAIIAPFSRIFCDVERFSDDSLEIMAKFGMGVLYEKADTGEAIRKVTLELRNKILQEYYWKHQNNLTLAVNNHLDKFGKALIVDCHSFPNIPLIRSLDQTPNRPDFNIGTDSFHTPQNLIEASTAFFKQKGYSLGIDWPYSGTIVPMKHYNQNNKVSSIMLEINRKLYLNELGNQKSNQYEIIKKITQEYLDTISHAFQ
jgi:N-formylglutamate amidohydrolase